MTKSLDQATIELANCYGPYVHGTWANDHLAIGDEKGIVGRSTLLASTIRKAISEKYTIEQMHSITVVDVGCYDGWILCQLEDLPFARLIGIEPRIKNIEKGLAIRDILGISTRCEFRQGSINNLQEVMGNEKAEIVLCCGLFHHLASIAEGVAALHSITSEFLFLESICLPDSFESKDLEIALELKDIAYFNSKKIFGITAHKYETSYYDGSTFNNSIVSIASVNTLAMYLNTGGFNDINILVDPNAYAGNLPPTERNYSAVCLTALASKGGGGGRPYRHTNQ